MSLISRIKEYFILINNLLYSNKNIPDDVNTLLQASHIKLFYIELRNLKAIGSDVKHFNDSLSKDIKLKECMKEIIKSLSNINNIINICININGKYYELSFHHEKKYILNIFRKKYVMCLMKDITHQVRNHHKMYQAYNEQLQINKMKTAFLSRMSHEFRTPLNAVIGFSDAMKHELYGNIPKHYLEYIDNIHLAGSHLLDIVNDIMDVSYHESHKINFNISDFSPITTLENILKFIHSLLARQKIIVNLSHELPNNFMLRNDLNIFKRIMINIIGNTAKYCPQYTNLDIRFSILDSNFFIHIRDYGKGFPQHVIDNFGTPFNVGNNFLIDTNKSIGLGLSIIKSSITAMNGITKIYNHQDGGAVIDIVFSIDVSKTAKNTSRLAE